jgi:uncharacterized protein YndB with AHSA1/START domain
MSNNEFVYTTYIKTTPEKVWTAITNPEFNRQYWGHEAVSDWNNGSQWKLVAHDNQHTVKVAGQVIESIPPKRLVMSWAEPADTKDDSRVTFEIVAMEDMVRLTVTHGNFKPGSVLPGRISMGWPLVLSSMKSFLETGKPIDIISLKQNCGGKAA